MVMPCKSCVVFYEVVYTKITEVNLSAFAYRLFHEEFSSIVRAKFRREIFMKQPVNKCR